MSAQEVCRVAQDGDDSVPGDKVMVDAGKADLTGADPSKVAQIDIPVPNGGFEIWAFEDSETEQIGASEFDLDKVWLDLIRNNFSDIL